MVKARPKSEEIFSKLLQTLPGGVNSPTRAFTGIGIPPIIVERGKGDLIWDFDGNEYIDFNMAWGSLILGHVDPHVVLRTKSQIDKGSSFGMTTPIELQLAEKLKELVPTMEKSRVVASGTEATMTAMRIARGFTKKNIIIKFNGHYHGHSDSFLVKAGSGVSHHFGDASSRGVPGDVVKHTRSLPFNDKEALKNCFDECSGEISAVIIEPVAGNMGVVPATKEFMDLVVSLTKKEEALLIFDEVITGFRIAKGGAQEYFNVKPDLSTFSKIIGGGYPVGVVGGRAEVMDMLAPVGDVYQAGTLSGNPVAMQGGYATLCALSEEGFYEDLKNKAEFLLSPVKKAIKKCNLPICLNEVGSMFSFFFGFEKVENFEDLLSLDRAIFNDFFIEMFELGIYLSPSPFESNFISSSHTKEHLEKASSAFCKYIEKLDEKISTGVLSNNYATSKS
ncbi:MAG: Glutamate-1-semialdehyde 2,1-aminomutase 1 [Chlamydiia bacterium]|nr:Glutamate-1-semialdehyde 2,1-aminomutase 1 [Chlamydiia bacterium]